MSGRFQSTHVLVTGASRGIGLEIARRFLSEGAGVTLTARKPQGLAAAEKALREQGFERFVTAAANSASPDEVRAAFDTGVEQLGPVDVLVNNAGTNLTVEPLATVDLQAFDRMLATNLRGYIVSAQEAIRRWREERRSGTVINVSTIGAHQPLRFLGPYCVTKAALTMATEVLAQELSGTGIRVNAVAPGLIKTRFSAALWKDPENERRMAATVPLGRLGEVEDVAAVVAFLASDDARYVNGEVVLVDGGMRTHPLGLEVDHLEGARR